MANQVFPTKGNLIAAKRSLKLAKLGYDLMDRKRNVLIRELMQLVERAKQLRGSIEETYRAAYRALEEANITLGVVDRFAYTGTSDCGTDRRDWWEQGERTATCRRRP